MWMITSISQIIVAAITFLYVLAVALMRDSRSDMKATTSSNAGASPKIIGLHAPIVSGELGQSLRLWGQLERAGPGVGGPCPGRAVGLLFKGDDLGEQLRLRDGAGRNIRMSEAVHIVIVARVAFRHCLAHGTVGLLVQDGSFLPKVRSATAVSTMVDGCEKASGCSSAA